MKYVNLDNAVKELDGTKSALVAIHDLKNKKEVTSFVKKTKEECRELLKNAKTIVIKRDDGFVREMDLFSCKQDIKDVKPIGSEVIILY